MCVPFADISQRVTAVFPGRRCCQLMTEVLPVVRVSTTNVRRHGHGATNNLNVLGPICTNEDAARFDFLLVVNAVTLDRLYYIARHYDN